MLFILPCFSLDMLYRLSFISKMNYKLTWILAPHFTPQGLFWGGGRESWQWLQASMKFVICSDKASPFLHGLHFKRNWLRNVIFRELHAIKLLPLGCRLWGGRTQGCAMQMSLNIHSRDLVDLLVDFPPSAYIQKKPNTLLRLKLPLNQNNSESNETTEGWK